MEIIIWIFTIFSNNVIGYANDLSFRGDKKKKPCKWLKYTFDLKLYYILIAKILPRIFAYLLIHEITIKTSFY